MMRWWLRLILFACLTAQLGQAQFDHLVSISSRDLVVVGTLHWAYRFPWLDGWNERGYIQVARVLRGPVQVGDKLPFAWEHPYHYGSCSWILDWTPVVGQSGVWILQREEQHWRAPSLFHGFLK